MEKEIFKTVNAIYEDFMDRQDPGTVLLMHAAGTFTVSDLDRSVERFTAHLAALKAGPGTVVGYTLPNCPEIFALFIAISRIGAIAAPLFPMIPDMGKADLFKKMRAALVITTVGQLPGLQEAFTRMQLPVPLVSLDKDLAATPPVDVRTGDFILKDIKPDHPLLLASSSGTTGIPKPVIMSQHNIASQVYAALYMAQPLDKSINPDYACISAFPLSTAGIITCLGYMFSGARQVFSADFSPVKYLQLIAQWKAECLAAPPAYFEGICALPLPDNCDLSSVRLIQTGMDFLSPSLLRRLKARFINLSCFANGYGLIETSNIFMCCKDFVKTDGDMKTGGMELIPGIGNAIEVRDETGTPVKPGSEGELCVKGPSVVHGYAGNPDETARCFAGGWFKTGDIVRNEGDNRVTLLGRSKYLIKRGGKSVSPVVVQNHIAKLAGIREVAVTGIPHPLYGEMIWAFIVTSPGSSLELKEVMRHCRTELVNYMVPDSVLFIPEIPKNPGVGKVNYEKLKEIAKTELEKMEGAKNV